MATIASSGTGLARTRYCQPAPSRRFERTCRNPLSASRTASLIGGWPPEPPRRSCPSRASVRVMCRPAYDRRATPYVPPRRSDNSLVTTGAEFVQIPYKGSVRVRGVRELAEQPGHDERDLLADVHGVVADPLQRARDQHHRHRPLAPVGVGPDLHGT